MIIAVIGSGLAGLTAAALLVKEGHSVTVYEQHERIGGVTATIEKEGYKWDWGQMLIPNFGEGESGRKILEKLGISDKVKALKSYRENYFPDFRISRPKDFQGKYWRKEFLQELFPEDAKGLDKYFKIYDRIHDVSALLNKEGFLSKIKLFLTFLPIMKKKEWSAQKLMDYCFTNKKLQAVFIAILADYVASPEVFPGLIIPTINAESQYDERVPLDYGRHQHRQSWSYIENGMGTIIAALAGFIEGKKSGKILTNTAINKINLEDGSVKSVLLSNNEEVEVDLVIASGGAKELYLDLVGSEHITQEFIKTYIDPLFTTESVFMVHLGVDYDPSIYQNNAALCYYYFTYDINESIKECQKGIYHEGKDGLLVYIPSKHSPEMAPPGHHAVTVYTIAPNIPTNGNWKENKEKWAEKLLDIAEKFIPGLREHTKTKIILTPEDFKNRTHLKHHAFGGTVPHVKVPPPLHKTPIKGLWFIGGQSENFGGVVSAMVGAESAVNMLLKDY
ncbi:MAG: NAD(P)/FAD-dependent oxidoreductase [Candidatus Lokiarchaeota archaeon]|nr:NAD(P)/FAD-dependent oxidoreductase [Candidatus Lokiarchaeota archaeon]